MRTETISITKPISRSIYNKNGNEKFDKGTEKNIEDPKLHAGLTDKYYSKELNKFLGVSEIIALFQAVSGGALWWCSPSPATAINEITTLGDLAQVYISRTNVFGSPNDENTRIRRSGATAWLQLLAGFGGIASSISDAVLKETKETKEMSFVQKIGLSLSSFFSAVFMLFGSGEKSILATMTQKNPNSKASSTIRMDGNSDTRSFIEELGMCFVPWFSNFKLFKKSLDYSMIYFALRDGIKHFIHNGVSMVLNNNIVQLDEKLKKILKAVFLISKDKENNGTITWPFGKKWFLGTEEKTNGFRSKYLIPILKAFGCNPPVCYLDKDNNIVSEYYEKIDLDLVKQESPYLGSEKQPFSKNGTCNDTFQRNMRQTAFPSKSRVL